MALHAKTKGSAGEMAVAKDLMLKGYGVFYELGDNSKIDLIAEKESRLIKIQVKAYTSVNGEYVDIRGTKSGPNYRFKYSTNDIEIFAIYVLDLDIILYVSSNFLNSQSMITIRLKESKNAQTKKVHHFKEFLSFENQINI